MIIDLLADKKLITYVFQSDTLIRLQQQHITPHIVVSSHLVFNRLSGVGSQSQLGRVASVLHRPAQVLSFVSHHIVTFQTD